VLWLEDYLRAYLGALLLISHDREFLDRVVTAVVHLERETLTMYTGNYSSFEQQRIAQRAGQQAVYARQQREIAHIRGYIDRFKTHASKARQAQSRMKALERMELIAPAHVDTPFRFGFRDPPKIPRALLTLDEVAAGYGQHAVFAGAKVQLVPGDRVGLLGPNGAGKSTLIKVLAGVHPVARGVRSEPQDVRIGYFAQHQLEQLDGAASPMRHLQTLDPLAREQDLRNFVGGFGFSGDMAYATVANFSGGEKARLVLALLVYQRPNVLLLDEPTNHLDLDMRHALTMALQDFGGAMVIVSHDRFLLRSVTDRWLLVADGGVQEYDGEIEAYRDWLNQRSAERQLHSAAVAPLTATAADASPTRKERKRSEAERRQRQQPLRKKIQELEAKLEALSQRNAALTAELAGDVYGREDRDKLKELLREQARVQAEVHETEEAWLAASESLQAGSAPDGS
jgi:ATP-binding cassette subfamily F protein 3